jgi:hypothetical protein
MSSSTARPRIALTILAAVLAVLGLLPGGAAAATPPQVTNLGTAGFFGDLRDTPIAHPIVDLARTPSGLGYWEVADDGGLFSFGDATFFGSTGDLILNQPIVAMASTATGNGYYFLARDGGTFQFGDATNYGAGTGSGKTYVDLVVDPDGAGYWLLAADGSVDAFGPTASGGRAAPASVAGRAAVGLATTPTGAGLWVAWSDGAVDEVGTAPSYGDGPAGITAVDLAAAPDGSGLWLVTTTGRVEALGGVTRSDDATVDLPVVAIVAHSADGYWVATGGPGPGAVTGRVLDDQGLPVVGLCVVVDTFGSPSTTTAADGRFRIALSQGSYRLRFGGCPGDDRYVAEYWKDATSPGTAVPVTVSRGLETAIGDAVVDRAGAITGVVRGADGQPLSTACTLAFADDGAFGGQARTTVTGYYRLSGLRSTSYRLSFNDCVNDEHLAEYYDDAVTAEESTPVVVNPGQTRSGIDAQLAKAGAITGTVATADGGSLGAACVTASNDDGVFKQANVVTGAYRITGLGTGAYKIHFNDCVVGPNSFQPRNDYVDEWWQKQATVDASTPVAVTAGQDTTGISTVLDRAATISGTVTWNGSPASFVCVDAVQGTTSVRRTTTASISGTYQLRGLRAGDYAVRFSGCTSSGPWAPEWWPNSPSLAGATPVAVTTGQQRTGIDAALDPGGYLQGQVTDGAGTPVPACIEAYDELGIVARDIARFNGVTGAYRIAGLNTNGYKLRFNDCNNLPGGYATEWFQDAASKGSAVAVAATAGQTRVVANAVLDAESVISGTVTSTTGAPIAGVCVRAMLPDGTDAKDGLNTAVTTVTGFYRATKLPAASYRVKFDTRCGPTAYASEWWDDKPTFVDGTPVVTTAGTTTAHIDAVLAKRTATGVGVPGAPASVSAVAGRESATVSWVGASDANGAVTGYRITVPPGGATYVVGRDERSKAIAGLTAGTGYTFAVQAANASGYGPGAGSNQVTPTGPPAATAKPSASPGDGTVTVSWSAPASNGSAITSYVVRASTDGAEVTVPGGTTSTSFARPNGVAVSFTVVARNAFGAGAASVASDPVTPAAPQNLPSNPTGDAPVVTGGDPQPTPVPSGSEVVFTGSGFAPFQSGDVIINSTPRKLGTFVADGSGAFRVVVTVPADLETGDHTLVAVGRAPDGSVRSVSTPLVVVSAAGAGGYRMLASDGGIFTFGDAGFLGSAGGTPLAKPIVGGAHTPSGKGYWIVGADGAVATFGDANWFGSLAGTPLNQPIVGMAATPSGKGYWLVATDGGIFAFGDAAFQGSTGAIRLNRPIVGMTSTPTGKGYWLVATDGGIFAFGDAAFHGSTGDLRLNQPIVGMSATPTGDGYRLVASDGGIFAFGRASFLGSTGDLRLAKPIIALLSRRRRGWGRP